MDLTTKRWQDAGNLLLGLWLFISPWALGYATDVTVAANNAYFLGAAIVVFAAVAVYMPRVWEEWINMAFGLWLIVSPWVLGFASHRDVTINAVVVGLLVGALATWAMVRDKDFERWWKEHYHATP